MCFCFQDKRILRNTTIAIMHVNRLLQMNWIYQLRIHIISCYMTLLHNIYDLSARLLCTHTAWSFLFHCFACTFHHKHRLKSILGFLLTRNCECNARVICQKKKKSHLLKSYTCE